MIMLRLAQISQHMTVVVPFAKFEEVFATLQAEKKKVIVLFTSDKNQDGTQWCPDCVAVKPIYETLEAQAKKVDLPLIMFMAGDRAEWKDPQNKFRKHQAIKLTSVPTFGLFDGNKLDRRLVEGEVLTAANRAMVYE